MHQAWVAFSIHADMLRTPAEYMAMDSQLPTSDSLNDGQIIERVTSSSQSSQVGSDEDEVCRRSAYHQYSG